VQSKKFPDFHIQGLSDLFLKNGDGVSNNPNFPAGSTMVLSGAPGTGKTTFALGLVRSMIRDPEGPEDKKNSQSNCKPRHTVYYISTEVNRLRLKRMFEGRGWFAKDDELFKPNPDSSKTTGLHVINPPLEIERPVKSSEELVNFIVRQISIRPPPGDGQFVFIIVDSVTALFKDSKGSGESRRQVHELVHRLQGQFSSEEAKQGAGALGMIMLLSEQGIENLDTPGMETYVADFVFNFGEKSLAMGARLRTLEVTKSQGANMLIGQHTWHILTDESLERVVAGKTLRGEIFKEVCATEGHGTLGDPNSINPKPWGTFVVLARPHIKLKRDADFKPDSECKCELSGINGLDQMLKFDPNYWFEEAGKQSPQEAAAIKEGNVTMIVGEAGTGKTSICFHVVAKHLAKDSKNQALLVGFEHDFRSSFQGFAGKYPPPEGSKAGTIIGRCEMIYRPRSGLHFNLFLMELRAWLKENSGSSCRVAIDGISNLEAAHPEAFPNMLDALIAIFAEPAKTAKTAKNAKNAKNAKPASLFLTYEAPQTENLLNSMAFRLPAHNIVLLSHKVIEDDRRTAVTVIKSSHGNYDSMARELVLDHGNPQKTYIHSGFDAFSGLLSGNLVKARVVLQLFQENAREKDYNRSLCEHLAGLLPYEITLRDFSRFEITSTLAGRRDHVKIPSGDVQIVTMDEWWLSHKLQNLESLHKAAPQDADKEPDLSDFHKYVNDNHLVDLKGFVGFSDESSISPSDFWCFEMEKVFHQKVGEAERGISIGPYALPAFLDFGMLCVHRAVAGEYQPKCHTNYASWDDADRLPWDAAPPLEDRQKLVHLLDKYLVPWCVPEDKDEYWFKAPEPDKENCLVDLMKKHLDLPQDERGDIRFGFAWDSRAPESSASFFYELAWAFGGDQELFPNDTANPNKDSIIRALSFVGYLVHHKLTPPAPTITDTAQSAFSRHFYSTFVDVVGRGTPPCDPIKGAPIVLHPALVSLGFMPPGPLKWQTRDRDEKDGKDREIRFYKRFSDMTGKSRKSPTKMELIEYLEPEFKNKSPNRDDIDELVKWRKFRKTLDLPEGGWKNVLDAKEGIARETRTGYGCCGAWMVGVKSPTAAPGLAQVLLQEMTSLSSTKKRARMGAGLPARKDFYQYYGDRPVTGIDYLSWNELLMFQGSRGRRRDRVYGPVGDVDPAKMHDLIQHALMQIMRVADPTTESQPGDIVDAAKSLARSLFKGVKQQRDKIPQPKS